MGCCDERAGGACSYITSSVDQQEERKLDTFYHVSLCSKHIAFQKSEDEFTAKNYFLCVVCWTLSKVGICYILTCTSFIHHFTLGFKSST